MWTYLPPFLPGDPWSLLGLALGLVALGLGETLWMLGCLRVAWRGDGCAAVLLGAGGAIVFPFAVLGRQALEQVMGPGWIGYTLPYVGSVFHRNVQWYADDAYVWGPLGLGLALGGLALVAIGGPLRRDDDRWEAS